MRKSLSTNCIYKFALLYTYAYEEIKEVRRFYRSTQFSTKLAIRYIDGAEAFELSYKRLKM